MELLAERERSEAWLGCGNVLKNTFACAKGMWMEVQHTNIYIHWDQS